MTRARVPIEEAIRAAERAVAETDAAYFSAWRTGVEMGAAADQHSAAIGVVFRLRALRNSGVTEVDGETP